MIVPIILSWLFLIFVPVGTTIAVHETLRANHYQSLYCHTQGPPTLEDYKKTQCP